MKIKDRSLLIKQLANIGYIPYNNNPYRLQVQKQRVIGEIQFSPNTYLKVKGYPAKGGVVSNSFANYALFYRGLITFDLMYND